MDSLDPQFQSDLDKLYAEYTKEAQEIWTPEQIEQLKSPLNLTEYQKSAISFILEQAITKISIINREFSGKLKISELPLPQLPLVNRFGEDFCNKLYDKETLQPIRDCYKAMTLSKFQKDVDLARCALETCLKELRDDGRFSKLVDFIQSEKQEAHDERIIMEDYNANLKILNDLQQQQSQDQQNSEEQLEELRNKLFRLKNECDEKRKTFKMEENMIERWEAARQQQTTAVFNHELKKITQQRDDIEEKTEIELVANNETMAFYRANCAKLKHEIDVWQFRLETEKKDLDERIAHTQANIEDVRSKYQLIQSWYDERSKFIDDYRREQAELEEQLRLEKEKTAAAVRIEAWWRGTMVRRQIGPYRQKKKGKKPKTAKK